jgi:catechol 2,3-dioxygenase-like lactoylglutathione lyase family enzyme
VDERTKEDRMLKDKEAMATVAVRDVAAARKFYEGTLGLEPLPGPEKSAQSYKAGRSTLLVYESRYAGTNQATAVTWGVGDVDGTVQALKAKGVAFEHYDMPGMTREGDVHVAGKMRVAWFKDPDGNIHSLVAER